MATSKKTAAYSARVYRDYHSARTTNGWGEQIALDRAYYLGSQWTDDEKAKLEERGQAPLVINLVYPIVQQKLAQLSAHKPVIRAMPVEGSDNNKAHLWSMMLEYVLQQSDFSLIDLEVKRNHIIEGCGYYYAYIDPYADDGKGEVRVAALPPDIVYVDPNSRRIDYSDADHILVSDIYTIQQAVNLFPDKRRQLNRAKDQLLQHEDYIGTSMHSSIDVMTRDRVADTPLETDEGKVRIIERYSKIQVPYHIVINEKLGFYDVVDQEHFDAAFRGKGNFRSTRIYRTRIERIVSAGEDAMLASEILPIEDYPVVPVPNIWVGTPYPLSDVRPLRSPQDETNKRRSLQILTATSNASSKWLAMRGSVVPEEWRRKMHVPGELLLYEPVGSDTPPPREVFAPPLPSALVHLEQSARHDLEYISGIFSTSHGDPTNAPETFRGTLALEEYANRRLSPSVEVLSHAKRVLGRVIIGLCQENYTVPKFIRVLGDEAKVQEVVVNEKKPQQIGGQMFQDTFLDQEKYDVIIQSGKFAPTNRMANAQWMLELKKEGVVDGQAVLESLDIPDKDKLIKRLGELQQALAAGEAKDKEIKKLEGFIQSLQRMLIQAGIRHEVTEARNLEKSALLDSKDQLRKIERDAELDQGKASLELQKQTQAKKESQTSKTGAGKTKE